MASTNSPAAPAPGMDAATVTPAVSTRQSSKHQYQAPDFRSPAVVTFLFFLRPKVVIHTIKLLELEILLQVEDTHTGCPKSSLLAGNPVTKFCFVVHAHYSNFCTQFGLQGSQGMLSTKSAQQQSKTSPELISGPFSAHVFFLMPQGC